MRRLRSPEHQRRVPRGANQDDGRAELTHSLLHQNMSCCTWFRSQSDPIPFKCQQQENCTGFSSKNKNPDLPANESRTFCPGSRMMSPFCPVYYMVLRGILLTPGLVVDNRFLREGLWRWQEMTDFGLVVILLGLLFRSSIQVHPRFSNAGIQLDIMASPSSFL